MYTQTCPTSKKPIIRDKKTKQQKECLGSHLSSLWSYQSSSNIKDKILFVILNCHSETDKIMRYETSKHNIPGELEVPGMEGTYEAAGQADMGQEEHNLYYHMKYQKAVDNCHHMDFQEH